MTRTSVTLLVLLGVGVIAGLCTISFNMGRTWEAVEVTKESVDRTRRLVTADHRKPFEVHEIGTFKCGERRLCVALSDGTIGALQFDAEGRLMSAPEHREPPRVHEVNHFPCGPDGTCVVMSDGSVHTIRIDSNGMGWIEEDPEREWERFAPPAATR